MPPFERGHFSLSKNLYIFENGVWGVAPSGVRAAAPHSAPARTPGVYAQRLCTMQSQQSIHSLSHGERGLGIGIENKHFFEKTDFFYKPVCPHLNGGIFPYYIDIKPM